MGAVDDVYGAWFIGVEVSSVCFGLSILQCFLFLQRWRLESKASCLLVIVVAALGFFHVCLTSHALYHYLVSSIGDPSELQEVAWSFKVAGFVSPFIVMVVQCFYGYRIWLLIKSKVIFAFIVLVSLTAYTTGNAGTIIYLKNTGTIIASKVSGRLADVALVADVVGDTTIMLCMFYFLRTNRTGQRGMDNVLKLLMAYTFASGLLTTTCAVVVLATYLRYPQKQIFSGASFTLPHLYINSFLALLNARGFLRSKIDTQEIDTSNIPTIKFTPNRSGDSAETDESIPSKNEVKHMEKNGTRSCPPQLIGENSFASVDYNLVAHPTKTGPAQLETV